MRFFYPPQSIYLAAVLSFIPHKKIFSQTLHCNQFMYEFCLIHSLLSQQYPTYHNYIIHL